MISLFSFSNRRDICMSYTTKLFCTINLVFALYGCTGLNSSTESIKSPVVKQTSTIASKSKKPIVLVTGGMGYIGSHVCVVLLNAGYDVIILDNLSNSKKIVLDRIRKITKKDVLKFYNDDMREVNGIRNIFSSHKIYYILKYIKGRLSRRFYFMSGIIN